MLNTSKSSKQARGSKALIMLIVDVRGAKAHKSSKDVNETQEVITIGFFSANGTRVGSAHAREDGTYAFFTSRAGR